MELNNEATPTLAEVKEMSVIRWVHQYKDTYSRPYFKETETSYLIVDEDFKPQWVSKSEWIEDSPLFVVEKVVKNLTQPKLIQAYIKDINRCWLFMLTEEELDKINKKELQLFWHHKKGWCLVSKKQREILLDPIDYDLQIESLTATQLSTWASIRRLRLDKDTNIDDWRNYKCVRRTPVKRKRKR